MRPILLLLCIFPLLAGAQINRSAKEFAGERIGEYITGKLFKDHAYLPLSFGELKDRPEKNLDIAWQIEHRFVIADTVFDSGKKVAIHTSYKFLFYLDKQMNVKGAETFYSNQ